VVRSYAGKIPADELLARGSRWSRKRKQRKAAIERDVTPLDLTDDYLLAIVRTLPGYDPFLDSAGYHFDCDSAREVINFFVTRIIHVRGDLAGKPFIPSEAQRAWLGNFFGWRRDSDGGPRYRTGFLTEARGEGKTTEAAGTALFVLSHDDTQGTGAEVYSAAYSIKQANLVWSQASEMVARDVWLSSRLALFSHAIVHQDDPLTSYQSIAAEANSAWGFQPRFVVVDELHAQRTRALVDALESAKSKRKDSQTLYITTAGNNPTPENICWEIYETACKVRDRVIVDPTFLPAIYEVAKDADWHDEAEWKKAHPNRFEYQLDDMRAESVKIWANPALENRFRQLMLNQWVSQADRWISLDAWRDCGAKFKAEDMNGRRCFGGLDLSETRDLSSFALCFPPIESGGKFRLLVWHWLPDKNLFFREEQDKASYTVWARQGWLNLTPGTTVDYAFVIRDILKALEQFRVVAVAYDRWNADPVVSKLEKELGVPMLKHGQGFAGMSGPSKQFERLILDGKLEYNENPLMDWEINQLACERDPAGNIKPTKVQSRTRIDGVVASIMAVGQAALEIKKKSVYSARGLLEF
jgi:phage terminase large subunit-like protein